MQTLNSIVFGWYPYLCLTVFLFGSLFRFDREQYTWRTGSSQLLRRRQLMWGSNLFHVGILVIFVGHFVGLLTPIWVFDMLGVSHGFKQMLAIVAGGVAGLMCLVGISLLTHRRLFDPRIRANSSFGDTAILLLLFAQLLLGLATIPVSLGHLDGHEMVKFMAWAQGILTLQPGVAANILDVHPIFKAHLVLGMTHLPACSRLPGWFTSGARRSGISAAAAIRSSAAVTAARGPSASTRGVGHGLLGHEYAAEAEDHQRQRHGDRARGHRPRGAESSGGKADPGLAGGGAGAGGARIAAAGIAGVSASKPNRCAIRKDAPKLRKRRRCGR